MTRAPDVLADDLPTHSETRLDSSAPQVADAAWLPTVELRYRDARGDQTAVVDGAVTLGSATASDVVVDDPLVSRLHAELGFRSDGLWVRDLGSKNGVFVNGLRVGSARLPNGVLVKLGSVELQVVYRTEPTRVALHAGESFGPLLGKSRAMRLLFGQLERIAPSLASVLIDGETGTGKELVARAIHEASPRRDGPFVVIDCAALPEHLIESELFGAARGAYTGAVSARRGAFEQADGGTLFLDELGELPLAAQPKLLRALETRMIRRVGETQERPVDLRVVSATHRDLRRMINEGVFREDLYFRLAVVQVHLPALRERRDDIPLLAGAFAERLGVALPATLMPTLASHPLPGNVRELRNLVERAGLFGPDSVSPVAGGATTDVEGPLREAKEAAMEAFEREYMTKLLARFEGNVRAAAEHAGVDKSYLHRLIRRYGLRG